MHDFFLGIQGTILWYTIFLGVSSSLALSVLALTMGCMRPIFDSKNLSKTVMSAWGLGFMFLSLVYVGWVLAVSAKPSFPASTITKLSPP